MFKKIILIILFIGFSSPSFANPSSTNPQFGNWVAGIGYTGIDYEATAFEDFNLHAIYLSLGYKIKVSDIFYAIPEIKIGTDVSSDERGFGTELEMGNFVILSVRGQAELDNGIYLFAKPSYANFDFSASINGQTAAADGYAQGPGLSAGVGYNFTDRLSYEFEWEQFELDNDISIRSLNTGFRYHF